MKIPSNSSTGRNSRPWQSAIWRMTVITIAAFIVSCAAFDLGDANKLQIGMSSELVLDLVSKGPRKTYTISLPGDRSTKLFVMAFDLKNAGTEANYFAVFENDKLLYWGYPYEFNRYPDPRFNEIGRLAAEAYRNN